MKEYLYILFNSRSDMLRFQYMQFAQQVDILPYE